MKAGECDCPQLLFGRAGQPAPVTAASARRCTRPFCARVRAPRPAPGGPERGEEREEAVVAPRARGARGRGLCRPLPRPPAPPAVLREGGGGAGSRDSAGGEERGAGAGAGAGRRRRSHLRGSHQGRAAPSHRPYLPCLCDVCALRLWAAAPGEGCWGSAHRRGPGGARGTWLPAPLRDLAQSTAPLQASVSPSGQRAQWWPLPRWALGRGRLKLQPPDGEGPGWVLSAQPTRSEGLLCWLWRVGPDSAPISGLGASRDLCRDLFPLLVEQPAGPQLPCTGNRKRGDTPKSLSSRSGHAGWGGQSLPAKSASRSGAGGALGWRWWGPRPQTCLDQTHAGTCI